MYVDGRSVAYDDDGRQRPATAQHVVVPAGGWVVGGAGDTTTRARRQDGQVELERSHTSTQAAWKPWPQCGSTRTSSPRANSARQMAHSGRSPSSSSTSLCCGLHDTVGSDCSAFFSRPPQGALAAGPSTEKAEGLQSREQRATMASPTTHSRKQSTAITIRTVSVCALVPPPAMAAAGGAAIAARRSTDCCSRWRGIAWFVLGGRWVDGPTG
ncbi:hypothetical protein VPH35_099463 [Triticum aestivum]